MLNTLEKIPHCDIFRPSTKEFQDFSGYLEKVTKQAKSGIFKVGYFNPGDSTKRLEGKERQLQKT